MHIDKLYFTLPEVLERWRISETDLVYLAENDKLRLSVRVFGEPVEFGDYEEGQDGERFRVPWEQKPFSGLLDLLTGKLESVTDLTLFGGANALAVETASGVWEIVQAGAAELLAPGRYRLTRLLRGQRGTESAMGNPAPAGARVAVLDTALTSLPIAEADLGIPWNWRIGPASRPVSDETYVAQTFTPKGVGLRPFSVAHVEQPWRKARSSGDLTIRWTRRSRSLAADSWGGLDVPLTEEWEAYEVEILEGATVKRVLNTTTTSAVYAAADQTADWGAPLAPGDTVNIRIYQFSALVGRGALKTITLTF